VGVGSDAGAGFDAPDFSFGVVGSGIGSDSAIKSLLQPIQEIEYRDATCVVEYDVCNSPR
jgi:hypothetical protein